MSDLQPVYAYLRPKAEAWLASPYGRDEINFTLPENVASLLRTYVTKDQPRIEFSLHTFVVDKLGDDISTPDVIEPTLVLSGRCPRSQLDISREIDLKATIGMANFIAKLKNPKRTLDDKEFIYCPSCAEHVGSSERINTRAGAPAGTHAPSYSRVRYTANTSRIYLQKMGELREMRALYAKERSLRERTALQQQHLSPEFLASIKYLEQHVDASLATLKTEEIDDLVGFFDTELEREYLAVHIFLEKVKRPLLSASVRVRKNPISKLERSIVEGKPWSPVSVKAEVATLVGLGSVEEQVDAYARKIISKFSQDREITIHSPLLPQEDRQSAFVTLTYAGLGYPVTLRLKIFSHEKYLLEQNRDLEQTEREDGKYTEELGRRVHEALLEALEQ